MTRDPHPLTLLAFMLVGCISSASSHADEIRVQVPGWAKHAVWYQIFPDRFRNGDTNNDPRLVDTDGAWPHFLDEPWQIQPWTSDWYEEQPWEKSNGRGLWQNIQRRRYGGDLQGILDKLDYLQDLGVNAIYLNPVFASPSLHKYDAIMYQHVDPSFGPDRDGDWRLIREENPAAYTNWTWSAADKMLLALIAECHARGMHVILDGVFNHMSMKSWPFEDVKRNQQKSPYADWFVISSWGDPANGTTFKYRGWAGVDELPEFREDENGLAAGPRDYIFAITRRWMDPNGDGDPRDGIDGWRLDVAFCIGHPFWKLWRQVVKGVNPNAYLVAEVVDAPRDLKPYLAGDEFDAVMNYNLAYACDEFLLASNAIPASLFDRRLRQLRDAFADPINYVQFNLFDSHDTARLATHTIAAGQFPFRSWSKYYAATRAEHGQINTSAPDSDQRTRQQLVAFFQMTYLGAPVIYYGDEACMWGANDPCCRKPMVWPDLVYDSETWNPDGSRREPPDPVRFDAAMHDAYRSFIHIRNEHEALRTGSFRTALVDDEAKLYGFRRETPSEKLLVVLNASDVEATARVAADGNFKDLLDPEFHAASSEGMLKIEVPAVRGRILVVDTVAAAE